MDSETLVLDLSIVAIELLVLILVVVVLNAVARTALRALASVKSLARSSGVIEVVRQNVRLLLFGAGFVGALAIVAYDAWLLSRGVFLPDHAVEVFESIPPDLWTRLAEGLALTAGLAVVLVVVLRMARKALDWGCGRCKAAEGVKANDESVEAFFSGLKKVVRRGAWLWFAGRSTVFLGLPEGAQDVAHAVLWIYLIGAGGLLVRSALDAVVASLDALSRKYKSPQNVLRYYDDLEHLLPLLRRALEYVIYVTVASLVALQVEAMADLADWWPRLVRVIGIVFLARLAVEILNLVIDEFLVKRAQLTPGERQQRLTIVPLIQSLFKYAVYFGAAVMVLAEIGINPMPVLAGAGIVGIAVGLGARSLISDFVHGFFILFEDYYLVGDVIRIGDAEGTIERVDLKSTRMRDENGRLHIIRNGTIDTVINYSKTYVCAEVEVGVAYESDLDAVHAAIESAGARAAETLADVLAPTHVLGVDDFGESGLVVRTLTKVKPGAHRQARRDIRRLVFEAFVEHGVEIPYSRRVLIWKGAPPAPVPAA